MLYLHLGDTRLEHFARAVLLEPAEGAPLRVQIKVPVVLAVLVGVMRALCPITRLNAGAEPCFRVSLIS